MAFERILLAVAAALASVCLIRLMRLRQAHLIGLLQKHLDGKAEWARKRAKAAALARMAIDQNGPPVESPSTPRQRHSKPAATTSDNASAAPERQLEGTRTSS